MIENVFFNLDRNRQLGLLLKTTQDTKINPEYIMEELYYDKNGVFITNLEQIQKKYLESCIKQQLKKMK